MLAKFAEDDRIEQMNAQKRRMKQLEHKRAVEALIEDRRKQFEAEKVRQLVCICQYKEARLWITWLTKYLSSLTSEYEALRTSNWNCN